jgi:[FeFe] hydrogenase H-cluster maturation GTPase HydF
MEKTPKSLRLHIGLFGRTNVGKSSILNMVAGQDVAITSPVPGTTTDVVEKTMELLPVGPVVLLDTGGLDDTSVLAGQRIARTRAVFDRTDVVILVVESEDWGSFEEDIYNEARRRNISCIIIVNKIDLARPTDVFLAALKTKTEHVLAVSGTNRVQRDRYVNDLKRHLLEIFPENLLNAPPLVADLVPPGGLAVLIVPIDNEAPKGRLILPQVQAIRAALDNGAAALAVRESEYAALLGKLKAPPDLVVCDSQVVEKMVAETPAGIPCTTFSILFSRHRGDLTETARGAARIAGLRPGDRILIAEACSHHALEDDIGRVKIPRWLRQYAGFDVPVDVTAGRDYPGNLNDYRLIIHCGGCMINRRLMLSRIQQARAAGVPITNYGVCIAFLKGVHERVLSPFPAALEVLKSAAAANSDPQTT